MGNRIITTTTNSIEHAEIEKYIDLISTNVVVGTNLFSDFGASLTDFFGGFSDSYQNKLQNIYDRAIDNLKVKAGNIGANAIIGLKIDFDEISGKGKSMFMISAIGTAVIIKFSQQALIESNSNSLSTVSNDRLELEVTRRFIISSFQNDFFPTQENWIFLFNNPIEEIAGSMLDQYLKFLPDDLIMGAKRDFFIANAPNYFKVIDKDIAINLLYGRIKEYPDPIIALIKRNKLFSPIKTIELIKTDQVDTAIACLLTDKEYYLKEDLNLMREIIALLKNIPSKGKIEMVKSMLGKPKEKYICPNGHSNDVEVNYCTTCGLNINGLTQSKIQMIENFIVKVESLSEVFKENTISLN